MNDSKREKEEEDTDAVTFEKTEDEIVTITYDEFVKVDIRIGLIESVEVVPDADKLLKLMVNVGEEKPRQILSAIRLYVEDPQSLVGVSCPFVLNLQPRVIRGLESQGMILAGSFEENLGIFIPSTPLPPGTKVK